MRRQRRSTTPRVCGGCHACCEVLGFEARPGEASFTKPAGVACVHLCPTGCGIYAQRPPVCARFQCAWLQTPSLPATLRPDRCGVLFVVNDNLLGEGYAVYAYELRPGCPLLEQMQEPRVTGRSTPDDVRAAAIF